MTVKQTPTDNVAALKRVANYYCVALAWPTVVLACLTAAAYVAVPVLAIRGSLSVLAASVLMAVITYAAYTPLHEAVHGAVCGGRSQFRLVNELVGYLAGLVTGIPLTAHRHEHFAHHGKTNEPGSDPDLLCSGMTDSLWAFVVKPLSMITNQYQFFIRQRWLSVSRKDRAVFLLESVIIVVARLALLGVMLTGYGASAQTPIWSLVFTTISVLVIGPVVGVIILVYLFAFIVHHPHQRVGPLVDTSIFEPPALVRSIVTWLWGFQNYHGIHHAFPRVPWYRYRALFDDHKAAIVGLGIPVHHLQRARWVPANY